MVKKLTDDQIWEREQAYKEHVAGVKQGKAHKHLTRQQFNQQWDKAHRTVGF